MEKRHFVSTVKTAAAAALVAAAAVLCNRTDRQAKLGDINLTLGDFKRSRASYEAIVDRDPLDPGARLGLGKAMLQQYCAGPGDSALLTDCIIQLEAARTLRPDKEVEKLLSVVWFKRASLALGRRDTLDAISALSRSISFDPASSKSVNLAGILYFHRGEPEKALTLFKMALAIDSLGAYGYFNAGMVYWTEGNFTQAYEYWYKAALRAPDDKEIITWAAMAKKRRQDGGR